MTGAVGCVAGTANGSFTVVAGVTTKSTLVDPAFGCAVEGETHFLEVKNCIDCFFAHDFGGILINEVVTTLDGVKGVPFPVVFFDICQGRAHATLGSTRVGPGGVELGEYGGARTSAGLKSRAHAGATGAHYHNIVNMCLHLTLPS